MKFNLYNEKETFRKFSADLRRKLVNTIGGKKTEPQVARALDKLIDGIEGVETAIQQLLDLES